MSLSETELKVFNSISCFVEEISSVFNSKPISLYNKLIAGTTFRDVAAIRRYIDSFKLFFDNNNNFITSKTLSENSKIVYNDRIYIDVNFIMRNKENKDIVYNHLVTIYSILYAGKKQASVALDILKEKANVEAYLEKNEPNIAEELNIPDTKEGDFIKESLNGIAELAKDIDLDSANANPAEMIGTVMNSDFFKNFAQNMQSKFQNGEINAQSLLQTVGSIVQQNGMGPQMETMLGSVGGLGGMNGVNGMK
jgi:hypothetical protein